MSSFECINFEEQIILRNKEIKGQRQNKNYDISAMFKIPQIKHKWKRQ